jgi:hypothetical protein
LGSWLFGGDRRAGSSPFDFGSDATAGLAAVAQTAGELSAGAILLLDSGNLYGAAALIRQLVDVEYLAWAFAEEQDEAAWLRSTKEERRNMWQPIKLRKRSGDRFRQKDYGYHCGMGGHPTPQVGPKTPALLPGRETIPP